MYKLLIIFTKTTLFTIIITLLVSCNQISKGNIVSIFVYNGDKKFDYISIPNGKSINGIDDISKSGEDETSIPYEYFLQNGKISLINNIINPLLHGINLTKDNSKKTSKGIKWTNEQIASSLEGQKNNLIKNAKNSYIDPINNNKKINQKELWKEFFKNYSTSFDSYYTKIVLLANENKLILNEKNNNLVTMTSNLEKKNNKDWVKELSLSNNKKIPYVPDSLKVLSPVALIIEWLNNSKNNYNKGFDKIEKNYIYQSARYIAIIIPNVTFRFVFKGEYNFFTFTVTIDKLIAYANYLVYKNPNSNKNNPTYGHQWFFINYGFYDFDILKDDDYHRYNFKINLNNIKIDKNIKISLGFVKKNNETGTLTIDEENKIIKYGKFPILKTDYNFSYLKWKINVDSISKK